MGDEVGAFLKAHSGFWEEMEGGRIRCLVTDHEMARSLPALKAHFEGRRFRNKVSKWKPGFDFAQFEPYIVPDKSNPKHFLYCRLTKRTLPRLAKDVEAHVQGRRYRSNLALQKREEEEEEQQQQEDDGIDQDEIPEFMRDDPDVVGVKGRLREQQDDDGDDEDNDENEEEEEEGVGGGERQLVELEENVFVFQGRNKKRKKRAQ